MADPQRKRLVAVSNRLPVVLRREGSRWAIAPGAGGLITALAPVLKARGGLWVGWPGVHGTEGVAAAMQQAALELGYDLKPVPLTAEQVEGYYFGFSNEILWPLFHGFETRCKFDPAYWQSYADVNRKFAEVLAQVLKPGDFVWIHDYQLMLVGSELKRLGLNCQAGFFLHIPFPAPDTFFKLPWRAQILRGLLDFDLVGFHTVRYRRNFTHCLQLLGLPGLELHGRGDVVQVAYEGRKLRVGAFPISIDFKDVSRLARSAEVAAAAAEFRSQVGAQCIMVGIDRLDYTKGIPERLEAFKLALTRYPELRDRLALVQLAVPSREEVREYNRLRAQIERLVGEINGEFTLPGQPVKVHYSKRSLGRAEVCKLLRAADVALVTPLKDGMNLVAKEFCASQVDEPGVLILSEFAGAAVELKAGALLVNPYDVEGLAAAMAQAALMPAAERSRRLRRMRSQIERNDIFRWVDDYLKAAFALHLTDFPRLTDHIPNVDLETFYAVND